MKLVMKAGEHQRAIPLLSLSGCHVIVTVHNWRKQHCFVSFAWSYKEGVIQKSSFQWLLLDKFDPRKTILASEGLIRSYDNNAW